MADLRGVRGVQMHPPLAASNVFLCTYLHKFTAVACSKQQPGTDTHSHISFLLISRRLSRPRVASRYSVWTSGYSLLASYNNNYVRHKYVYATGSGRGNTTIFGCASRASAELPFLNF